MGLRQTLNEKPMLGWIVAGVALLAVGYFVFRSATRSEPDSIERRSQQVTIRCMETNEEWSMNRGEFERLLLLKQGLIDPSAGIPSKFAEGRPTGVLVDKADWLEAVERINAQKKALGVGG